MHKTLEFLLHHGHTVLLAWVFIEQIGLPLPSLPILLAAGALAGSGKFSLTGPVFLPVSAWLASVFAVYHAGSMRRNKILELIFKIYLEPDVCGAPTASAVAQQGVL